MIESEEELVKSNGLDRFYFCYQITWQALRSNWTVNAVRSKIRACLQNQLTGGVAFAKFCHQQLLQSPDDGFPAADNCAHLLHTWPVRQVNMALRIEHHHVGSRANTQVPYIASA